MQKSADRDRFLLASSTEDGQYYALTGNTVLLTKFTGSEISIQGEPGVSTQTYPCFQVISLNQVFKAPKPALIRAFTNPSKWHRELNKTYGIKFAYPDQLSAASINRETNFEADQNLVTIASLEIPREVYPHTNL